MADISILGPNCDDDDDCDDGKRGKRGKRGHRGHRGPEGPEGPQGPPGPSGTAVGGLLKFSGVVSPAAEGGDPIESFLEDWGTGTGFANILDTAPNYPIAIEHTVRNMATNLLDGFIVPVGGSIVIELLRDGVLVPGFTITYGTGETGIKTVIAGPELFAIGQTIDMRVTVSGPIAVAVDLSATIGIE